MVFGLSLIHRHQPFSAATREHRLINVKKTIIYYILFLQTQPRPIPWPPGGRSARPLRNPPKTTTLPMAAGPSLALAGDGRNVAMNPARLDTSTPAIPRGDPGASPNGVFERISDPAS